MLESISKLTLARLILAATALAIVSALLAFIAGFRSAAEMARDQGKITGAERAFVLAELFRHAEQITHFLSESPVVTDSFGHLHEAFAESNADLVTEAFLKYRPALTNGLRSTIDDPGDGSKFSEVHKFQQPRLRNVVNRDEIYDLLFIDLSGRVFYTFRKESDFGADIFSPRLAASPLTALVERVLESRSPETVMFSDFAPYEPSQGKHSAFLGRAVFGADGKMAGVVATQLLDTEVHKLLEFEGPSSFYSLALTGPDGKLRPDRTQNAREGAAGGNDDAIVVAVPVFGEFWNLAVIPTLRRILVAAMLPAISGFTTVFLIALGGLLIGRASAAGALNEIMAISDYLERGSSSGDPILNRGRNSGDSIGQLAASISDRVKSGPGSVIQAGSNFELDLMRAALEACPIGAIVVDGENRILYANGQAIRLLKFAAPETQSDVFGRLLSDLGGFFAQDIWRSGLSDVVWRRSIPPFHYQTGDRQRRDWLGALERVDHNGKPATVIWFYDISDRKNAERAHQEAEHFLEAVIESLPMAIYVIDSDSLELLLVNSTALHMSGLERNAVGRSLEQLFPPAYAKILGDLTRETSTNGAMGEAVREEFTNKFGEKYQLETRRFPVSPAGGRKKYVLAISEDIRDRLTQEESLRNFYLAVDQVGSSIFFTNPQGEITYVNRGFVKLTGFEESEAVGRNPRLLNSGRNPAHLYSEMWGAIAKGKIWRGKLQNRRKDGSLYWVDTAISPITDRDGAVTRYVAIEEDITLQVAAEEKTRKAEAWLKSVIDSAPEGMVVVAPSGKIVISNRQMSELFGYDEREFIDLGVEQLLPERFRSRHISQRRIFSRARSIASGLEFVGLTKDGREFPIEIGLSPLPAEEGAIPSIAVTIRDITEKKKAVVELATAKDAAESATRAKALFLAAMSHEIRTPMNGLIGMADLLSRSRLTDDQRSMLGTLLDSGRALLRIVNDILDFSKIEDGKMETESVPVDLAGSIQSVASTLQPEAAKKGVGLDVNLPPVPIPFVLTDPTRLRQILLNLIGNAIKFTSRGQVKVCLAIGETVKPDGCRISIAVRDSGIGISPERQKQLFQPFTQADVSTTRRFGGTGLGLSIARRLAQLLGGDIALESEEGRGSTFTVTLDLKVTDQRPASIEHVRVASPIEPPDRDQARQDRTLILVAEDNTVNQLVIGRQLTTLGYAFDMVDNGRLALEALSGGDYALLLTDCNMPEMDGYELTRRVRAGEGGGVIHLPILAVTANAAKEEFDLCISSGMDGVVSKPVETDKLGDAIKGLIGPGGRRIAPGGAAKTAANSSRPVDPSRLAEMFGDDPTAISQVLSEFVRATETEIAVIEGGLTSGQWEPVQRGAHKLKSSAATVGATSLSDLCAKLESAAKLADRDEIARLVSRLGPVFGSVRDWIKQESMRSKS